jgi:CubicO group peptidase (beta-lactamase class C family)
MLDEARRALREARPQIEAMKAAGVRLLDDPIVKWVPELANRRVLKDPAGPIDDTYPATRDITIEDLLTHRSGLAEA